MRLITIILSGLLAVPAARGEPPQEPLFPSRPVADSPLVPAATGQMSPGTTQGLSAGTTEALRAGTTEALRAGTTEALRAGTTETLTSGTTEALGAGTTGALAVGTTEALSVGPTEGLGVGTTEALILGTTAPLTPGTTGSSAIGTVPLIEGATIQPEAVIRATAPPVAVRPVIRLPKGFKSLRAVHLTSWAAGSKRSRRRFLKRMAEAGLNAVVVAVKETDGKVYLPGLEKSRAYGTRRIAIPNPEEALKDIHDLGMAAVARVVVFKDDTLARKKPEWAVKDKAGGIWKNKGGVAWADPYLREVWEYNVDLASRAAVLGFDEIQFDYIRFPSDGDIRRCRYSRVDHSSRTAVDTVNGFLRYARERLAPTGVLISAAVFGLTTSARSDLGIGQDIDDIAVLVDRVSPMIYPSHYAKGVYGIEDPNREPHDVVYNALRDARRRLGGSAYKLQPYLQDFSLGFRYGPEQVAAQIQAARKNGVESWIFWNPRNRYTWEALVGEPAAAVSPPSSGSPG